MISAALLAGVPLPLLVEAGLAGVFGALSLSLVIFLWAMARWAPTIDEWLQARKERERQKTSR